MATLNSIVPPSRINYLEREWSTVVKRWPNGKTTKKRMWANGLNNWEVEWDAITYNQMLLLVAHFDAQFGQYGTFQFTDTHIGVTYNVQYSSDKFRRNNIKPNSSGHYSFKAQLEEVR